MNTPSRKLGSALLLCAAILMARPASAVMVMWVGRDGVSATTNWSDTANWTLASSLTSPSTPVSDAANFTWYTAASAPGIVTVNVDGGYGTPGSGNGASYGAFFGQTNGYHTVYIQPGVSWFLGTGTVQPVSGGQGVGIEVGPQNTNNNNIANFNTVSTGPYTNYTTITGINGTLYANVGASSSSFRVEGASTTPNNHYSILDMSGLGTFVLTNNNGLASAVGFYVVNGGQNSQALCYLAQTNIITLNNNFQVGYLGSSSNSLPIGVYLGQSNYISTGANNNTFVVAYTGCTNGFLEFNPSLIGGPSMPSAYITGTSGNQTAIICSPATGNVPGYGICDFTGGTVTWIGNSMKIGVSGTATPNTAANGVLTFTSGTVAFNTFLVGDQTVSNGAPGVGTINIGTNATLQANASITLGAATNTINAGTGGTINLNGTLVASLVTNGGAGSTINMTNAILSIGVSNNTMTNITVANFNAGGATNTVNISSIPAFLGGSLPLRFHLIGVATPANLVGASTFVLGTLPVSPYTNFPYQGHLDTSSTPGLIDFVLTAAPPSVRSLTWTGLNGGSPDGNWDVATTVDWETNNVATFYNQFDLANFFDVSSPAQTSVSLTTNLTPSSVTVSNNTSLYTIGLSSDVGNLSGTTGLTKAGSGTLVLDNSVSNSFTGGVAISGGVLQIGTNDANGNLPSGVGVTDNSILLYDRTDDVVVSNLISGSGEVISGGGGTLQLAGPNSFTGASIATNSSTLQSGALAAFGTSTNSSIVIASGSTYDPNGFPTAKAIIVSGTGVGGNGAIVNSGGPIYDSAAALSPSITLAGNTTFSFPTRWDYGLTTGTEVLSTGGHAYNLTMNGTGNNSYFEWRDINADPALANIDVVAGQFGIVGGTTLGSTNSSLIVEAFATIKMYEVSSSNLVSVSKPVLLHGSSFFLNESGPNSVTGPMTLTNDNSGYCEIDNMASPLTISGAISGSGILWSHTSTGVLVLTGNDSAFTGGALVSSGGLAVNNTFGSGITNAANTLLYGNGTVNGFVDVSGVLVPGPTTNTAGTFTAAAGLALESGSSLVMNLTATTNVGGANSLVAVTGNLNLNGTPALYINPIGTLVDGTYTIMTYSGTLSGTFGTVQTINPSSYSLMVSTNTPNQIQLIVNGAPLPAKFTGPYTISNSILNLMGTGGLANGTYRVYTATNLTTPFSNWVELTNGSFDGSGNFNFQAPATNGPQRFYILEEP